MEFTLRPWRTDDAESVAALADNAKIAANLRDGFPHPYTSDSARAFIAACLGADETSKLFYAIDIGGAAAGSIGVFGKDDVYRKTAELGYWLGEPFWGGGVMTRAVYLICRIAFSKLDIVRIEAEPYAWNAASRRVLEKTGFELEGVLEKNVFKNGALGDSCVYALIRGDLDREALGGLDKERLWELFPVVLSDYRDEWVMYFMLEKTVLEYFVGPENIFRISHIGSTAVPGLLSKPTVDILLEIKSGVDCQALITAMRLAGYGLNYRPDKASPHLTFIRGYTSEGFRGQVFHVHVRYPGDWDELYFRDYLRADPCAAEQYAGLKRSLLKDYVNDRDSYTGAKTDFIRRATERARAQLGQIYGAES